MKKYSLLLLLFALCMGVFACSDNDDKNKELTLLSISQSSIEVPAKSNDFTLTMIASKQPTAECSVEWLSASFEMEDAAVNRYLLTVSAQSNPNSADRWGIVTVKAGNEVRQLKVVQLAAVAGDSEADPTEPTATNIARQMGLGINIGNTLEAIGGETAWGAELVNRDYVKGIKDAGFTSVRVPCSWNIYMDDNNVISDTWLDRVHEVVGYCIDEGLFVVLNDHWDNGWIEKSLHDGYNDATAKRLADMWTQIANKMEHYDYHLMFAGFNEPDLNDQEAALYHTLTEYGQVFVDAVRATGGNNADRVLIMQAPSTSFDILVSGNFDMPEDIVENRMMAECHFYSPYNFVLMANDEDWGKTFWFWGQGNHVEGSEHNPTWGEEDYIADTLKPVYGIVSQGMPVIMGEYGCMYRSQLKGTDLEMHQRSRYAWAKCVTREAVNNGIIPFWWDTPGGLINRKTGAVDDQSMVDAIKEGATEASSPY